MAQAQTAAELVGNTGQDPDLGFNTEWRFDYAQSFTTGGASDGYKLTRVDIRIRWHTSNPAVTFTVSIHSDSSGNPGTVKGTPLEKPSSFSTAVAGALATFTAPSGGIDLDRNTTYWLVIDTSTGNKDYRYFETLSNNEDPSAASGWSIADGSLFRDAVLNFCLFR